jgi:hypothetical protein
MNVHLARAAFDLILDIRYILKSLLDTFRQSLNNRGGYSACYLGTVQSLDD